MIVHRVGAAAPKELILDVTLAARRDAVWRCWTEPALLMDWHCPKPWRVASADLDLRAGGRYDMVFAGPNGERMDHRGAYLEVSPRQRLVFTDAFSEDFIPNEKHFMTGYAMLSDAPAGATRMAWGARHATDEDMKTHLEMGFVEGWQAAARQLESLAATLRD